MDGCRSTTSSSSSSSSRWRHPAAAAAAAACGCTRSSVHDEQHGNLAVDVGRRFLPSTFVRSLPGPPPPPLHAGSRYIGDGGVKLERAPTPTRADRLLVAPGDEHAVTLCFPAARRHHGWSTATTDQLRDVKLQVKKPTTRTAT